MDSKATKSKNKNAAKFASVRISLESKKLASSILAKANTKKFGRKVKFDELIALAISLVTPEHIKVLQEKSMTNEDRKELLRQKYIEARGPITRDEL